MLRNERKIEKKVLKMVNSGMKVCNFKPCKVSLRM